MTEKAAINVHIDESTAQYEVTKRDWEKELNKVTPDWMNLNKMFKKEFEQRLDKDIQEIKDGHYVDAKKAFKEVNKKLGL